jgi:hypothetical protein
MLVTYGKKKNAQGQAFRLTYVQGVSSDPRSKLLVLQETKPLPDGVKKASSTARHLNCYGPSSLGIRLAYPQEFPEPLQHLNNKPNVVLLNERGVTELMWALRHFKSPDSGPVSMPLCDQLPPLPVTPSTPRAHVGAPNPLTALSGAVPGAAAPREQVSYLCKLSL